MQSEARRAARTQFVDAVAVLHPVALRLQHRSDFLRQRLGLFLREIQQREAGNHRADAFNRLAAVAQQIVQLPGVAGDDTGARKSFAEQMRQQGVTVLGVSVDADSTALQNFVADQHLSFPILRDPDRSIAHRYGTFQFPETYIIDQDGRVAEKLIGAVDWQDPRIATFVRDLAHRTG